MVEESPETATVKSTGLPDNHKAQRMIEADQRDRKR
jgi:hypothetical protein